MLTPVAFNILGNAATVTGLTFASGKSLTVNNILTLAGTDGSTLNIGAGGTLGSAAFTASGAYQPHTANLDTWTALAPSANGQSLVTAANYAAMRALLDLEAGTDFYSIAAADALLAAKAPLASPPLTGVPTAPTAAAATNTTQIATTAFVQQELATAVAGLLDFKGNVDASGNPNYPAALKGDTYYVNVAGKIGGASGKSVDIGDAVIAGADNAGGTEASVGSSWFVLEHNLSGALLAANNLSDVANVSTARTNLGLGTGNSPTFAGVTATTFTGALTGNVTGNINGTVGATTPAAGTFTALSGTSGSHTGLTALAIRDTSAAFDVTIAATSSITLTTGRTLTLDLVNAARTLKLTGNPTLADWFDQSVKTGASPTFVTVTAALTGIASGNALTGAVTGSGLTMATARLLGRSTASLGAIEEITIGTGLSLSGGALSATGSGGVALGDSPTWIGVHTFTPAARSSGHAPYLTVNAPTDTNLDASTEAIGVRFAGATRQHATGALTTQREFVFEAPTYTFAATSVATNVATVTITGAPSVTAPSSATNKYSLWVQSGLVRFASQFETGDDILCGDVLTVTSYMELGHPTDTTFQRTAPGKVTIEGKAIPLAGGASDITFAGPTAARTYTLPDADTTFSATPTAIVNGRLTTEANVSVSTSDRTAQGTIRWTAHNNGNQIALYDGTTVNLYTFASDITLALSVTSGKLYDVFIYPSGTTPTLELGPVWANSGQAVTGATNATPIVITAVAHGLSNGDEVYQNGIEGNTAANGTWIVANKTADTYELTGSVGNGAYTANTGWLNARAAAGLLVLQNGFRAKTGATTRRYVGTLKASGTNTTEMSQAKQYVWNLYNQVRLPLFVRETNSSWTLGTSGLRQVRATPSNQVEAVIGIAGPIVELEAKMVARNSSSDGAMATAIGEDSTTVAHPSCVYGQGNTITGGANSVNLNASLTYRPTTPGYHKWTWLENTDTATASFFGASTGIRNPGMTGFVEG